MISSATKLSIGLVVCGSLAACATARPGTTNITSADAPPEAKETPADVPEGELVCRAPSNDGTTELFLTWKGGEAKGILRTIAPSGNVTTTRVNAARYKSRIIADDVTSTDLVAHAAVVAEENGKRRIRIEELGQARWVACE